LLATGIGNTFGAWQILSAQIPGTGRLALRYEMIFDQTGLNSACAIDALIVGGPSIDAPLPGPGETVHWTSELSPILVTSPKEIPETATLVIDAGVEVIFQTAGVNDDILVKGELRVEGTSAEPVVFTRDGAMDAIPEIRIGQPANVLEPPFPAAVGLFEHLQAEARIRVVGGSAMTCTSSTFVDTTDATFNKAGVVGDEATVGLHGSTFLGCDIQLNETWLDLDASTFDNTPLRVFHFDASTPTYIDNAVFTNSTTQPPIQLTGYDHYVGPNADIAGNMLPVSLRGAGLAPGSVVPTTGNSRNVVEFAGGAMRGVGHLANIPVPYLWRFDSTFNDLGGILDVEPGVTIEFEADAGIEANFAAQFRAIGRPDAPITLRSHGGARWSGVHFGLNWYRPQLEFCIIEGAEVGVIADQTAVFVGSSILRDNATGALSHTYGSVTAESTEFLGNDEGVHTSSGGPDGLGQGHAYLDGDTNPNWFEGNGTGVNDLGTDGAESASFNWWGDSTGPLHPSNPGGQGDSASATVQVLPFLTTQPDRSDHAPLVRFEPIYYFMTPGEKMILHWSAEDDGAIASQRLLFSPHNGLPLETLVASIPASARSVEITVPEHVPSSNNDPPVLRIVAVDDQGQEGWDDEMYQLSGPGSLSFEILNDLSGGVTVGQQFELDWEGDLGGETFLLLDDMRTFVNFGYHIGGVSPLFNHIPAASTDLARYAVFFDGWYLGEEFTIRPHALSGDLPPQVTLNSPGPGATLGGGTTVAIQWTATDDGGLRSVDLHASYDGGATWHPFVRNLPGTTTAYDWALPASEGIQDVRVRVIVRDTRFQVTSSTVAVSISAGGGAGMPGDINGDGVVSFADLLAVISAWGPCEGCLADIDGDGVVGFSDLLSVLTNWT